MFGWWYYILVLKWHKHHPESSTFCLVSPQNIFLKVWRIFVFFLFSNGFQLETVPWRPFLPSAAFVENVVHCSLLESKKKPIETHSRLIDVSDLIYHLFLNFFRSKHDVLLYCLCLLFGQQCFIVLELSH
ncbi:hypothetical protein GOODEAATRI_021084 [Goodea atripinnis]|uniref:Maturase K n=1 Tax=Goodea atripinnis TaxID=208336 RepID=A0ABV0MU13_9TELE